MSVPEGPRVTSISPLRLAIVHEKFTVDAGAERCVEQFHHLWPDAPIFTTVCDPSTLPGTLRDADIRPSPWLSRLYAGGDRYAHLLPLLGPALARHDLRDYDVIVTSHHAFANRIRPRPDATVVAYTHTPARWLWYPEMRAHEVGGRLGRYALGTFAATQRRPDRRAAQRVNAFAANSTEVAARIERWWGRESVVVAPPVDTEFFTPIDQTRDDFFLVAGRLVPYKRPEVAVAAAREAGVRLVVAGDGRARERCESVAGPDTEFIATPSRETLRDLFRRCRALLYPGVEDFGIMPVEAQACGAPVIALDAGGARDTVIDAITGVRYARTADPVGQLAAQLRDFDDRRFSPDRIRTHATTFGIERFRATIRALVDTASARP